MNISKETETEILRIYDAYMEAYLRGDMDTFASYMDDHIIICGTAPGEQFTTKNDAIKFYSDTAHEMTGKAELRNRKISVKPVENSFALFELSHLYIQIDGEWTFYGHARITALFEQRNNSWTLVHQHASFPDGRTEAGQQIASDKIKEENLQLREAVMRRTVELENKTRELEIESSLERVRTVAMGMRKPEDLLDVCEQLYNECLALGLSYIRNAIINIHDDEHRTFLNYDYSPEIGKSITPLTFDTHPIIEKQIMQVRSAKDAFSETSFTADELAEWKAFRKNKGETDDLRIDNLSGLYYYLYAIGSGSIGISTFEPASQEHVDMVKRFRNVFALAYQRYSEILFAEAQARESQIEAAMERVRGRSMAMRSSDELSAVIKLIYQELDKLKFNNESTDIEIGLLDEETGIAAVWAHLYQSDGTIATFNFPLAHFEETKEEWLAWINTPLEERNALFFTTIIEGDRLQRMLQSALDVPELAPVFQPLIDAGIEKWVTHNAYFSHGMLTLQGTEPYPPEALDIQKRFARVFEQTYIRFLDLKKAEQQTEQALLDFERLKVEKKRAEDALTDLKAAQAQLIQSEKMASLGELTAGIAHEIQNPLNFVNNFAEVSSELVQEMQEEISTGHASEVVSIANNLKDNMEKILHHGKRADAIVKGMLQHSRSSTGQKEPTAINDLADEFIRLAFHGLRARDKSFNATIKTDFDPGIGTINVIPQEIGRVLLNLITNAFHAVSTQKSTKGNLQYMPTVIIATRLMKSPSGDLGAGGKGGEFVQITISDNGPGIPDHIKDKIFQPFFTTKPTGQGTGLGLSLSYDIIKAHGGDIQLETKEGEFAKFIITLPI